MKTFVKQAPLIVVILLAVIGVGNLLARNFVAGGIILLVALLFFSVIFKRIPANPPHKGQVIVWGKRIPGMVLNEGYCFLAPFFPFFYNVILVNVEKNNKDFSPQDVKSSEQANMEIAISITYTPDPNHLVEYINSGWEGGVEAILDDVISEETRQFAVEQEWKELLKLKDNLFRRIVSALTGKDGVDLDTETTNLRSVNGSTALPSLGVILHRLNVKRIKETGGLAVDAENVARERQQKAAETIEIEHVQERAKAMAEALKIPMKDAIETIQIAQGQKVVKTITEIKGLDGIGEAFGKGFGSVRKN